jgi:serine phosphatase RsbU (regulator of sigma subunit)
MLHIVLGCAYVVAFAFLTWNAELSPFYYELPKDIIRVFASFNIFVAVVFGVVFVTVLNRENMRFEKKIGIQNQKLQAQNDEIEAQHGNLLRLNEKISKQNAELQESNQIIENKNYTILQSIRYAQRIQNAVLPSDEQAKLFLPEHFIFFRPCDIVSGDFYFFKKLPRQILLAAADCTGHGVPGAFMSMLGITLLNEITQKSHIYQANEVLDELRIQIKKSLRQVGKSGEQQDGLDIALCLISSENLEMSFSGAYNSCLIFRKKTSGKVEKTILEADRQPVGIYPRELPFSEHKFYLQHDDVFYLFSDGYQSQFGGEKNEKMKSKRFKGLLEQIFDLPVEEQKYILEKNFDEWKGDNAQTDDVVVIGVRIDNKFNQSKQYD